MVFLINSTKPKLKDKENLLCSFRTSKAYLWGLVKDRLYILQKNNTESLKILDAACHELITRDMFPTLSLYYGLDVSKTRLIKAKSKLHDKDQLYLADLSIPLPLENCFDVVVSCNTFSHLPMNDQPQATINLIKACKVGGDTLINTSIDSGLLPLTVSLLNNFDKVEAIYFDSYKSELFENKKEVNSSNVRELVSSNEEMIPNDACLHRQVLLHCINKKGKSKFLEAPRSNNLKKIIQLNQIPFVERKDFKDDDELFNNELIQRFSPFTILSPDLAESKAGELVIKKLKANSLRFATLDLQLNIPEGVNNILVIGLETQWSIDLFLNRLALNRLRKLQDVKIVVAFVKYRGGKRCTPSLIANDL